MKITRFYRIEKIEEPNNIQYQVVAQQYGYNIVDTIGYYFSTESAIDAIEEEMTKELFT
jgi:hypothetical protein